MSLPGWLMRDNLKIYTPLILAALAFISFRYYVLTGIYIGRDLPIEIDDSLVYILNFHSNFLGGSENSVALQSAREFSTKLFQLTSSENAYFAANWTKGGGYIGYSLWSKLITEAVTNDPFQTLIFQSFIIQPILLFAFILFARTQTQLTCSH